MNLKEVMLRDIRACLLNPEEFADFVTLHGERVLALVEALPLDYPDALVSGLRRERCRVFVPSSEAPDPQEIDRTLNFNDKKWIIEDASEEAGLTVFTLFREVM